jgi:hypothetical protein
MTPTEKIVIMNEAMKVAPGVLRKNDDKSGLVAAR